MAEKYAPLTDQEADALEPDEPEEKKFLVPQSQFKALKGKEREKGKEQERKRLFAALGVADEKEFKKFVAEAKKAQQALAELPEEEDVEEEVEETPAPAPKAAKGKAPKQAAEGSAPSKGYSEATKKEIADLRAELAAKEITQKQYEKELKEIKEREASIQSQLRFRDAAARAGIPSKFIDRAMADLDEETDGWDDAKADEFLKGESNLTNWFSGWGKDHLNLAPKAPKAEPEEAPAPEAPKAAPPAPVAPPKPQPKPADTGSGLPRTQEPKPANVVQHQAGATRSVKDMSPAEAQAAFKAKYPNSTFNLANLAPKANPFVGGRK